MLKYYVSYEGNVCILLHVRLEVGFLVIFNSFGFWQLKQSKLIYAWSGGMLKLIQQSLLKKSDNLVSVTLAQYSQVHCTLCELSWSWRNELDLHQSYHGDCKRNFDEFKGSQDHRNWSTCHDFSVRRRRYTLNRSCYEAFQIEIKDCLVSGPANGLQSVHSVCISSSHSETATSALG